MDCQQARNLFDAYLDGDLSSALETELHAHRLKCAACRHELALMEVAGHVIRSDAGEPRLDAAFTDRLLACVEPAATASRWRRQWIIRIGGVVAAAACLTGAVMLLSGPETKVAGRIDMAPDVQPPSEPAVVPTSEPTGPELEEAVTRLQDSVEDVLLKTRESSSSLKDLGEKTLLELFDALETEALTEPEPDEGAVDDQAPAEDVEDL